VANFVRGQLPTQPLLCAPLGVYVYKRNTVVINFFCDTIINRYSISPQVCFNEPTIQKNKSIPNLQKNDKVDEPNELTMSVEVLGDMPKIVVFEKESTIQVRNEF